MLRAYQPNAADQLNQSGFITLAPEEEHHLSTVRRLRPEETVEILDGKGDHFYCIKDVGNKNYYTLIRRESSPRPRPQLSLILGIPKGKTPENIIAKAIELGVSEIIPLETQQGEIQFNASQRKKKQEKWKKLAIESIKQSGNPYLPKIHIPHRFSDWIKQYNPKEKENTLSIVGSLRPQAKSIREWISNHHTLNHIQIAVGPEGDFSEKEYEALNQKGVQEVSLGKLILKTETAALSLLIISKFLINNSTT